MKSERTYVAIDLKSFYASVECRERGLDPLTTNLVVADKSRTEKTICLAVTPSLKAYGVSGRARLFEVVQKVREVNALRKMKNGGRAFGGESWDADILSRDPSMELTYIVAPPRMALYMEYSTRIYDIYLQFVAREDRHVYSIDEVFIDVTDYLGTYKMSARDLAMKMIKTVLKETGITATAGIGTNLYLAKIAMDIDAKHIPADEDGVRISQLDEMSYRKRLWTHEPITDFWRVGRGYAKKLAAHGMYTMGDVARCSIGKANEFYNEDLLYRLFGVNAQLLIDHAWGYEPCTMKDIRGYRPQSNSISSGQVLKEPYTFEKARIIVREMAELLALDLVKKEVTTDQIVLTVGYDIENLTDPERSKKYRGQITSDFYGRKVPKHAHGTANLEKRGSSSRAICSATMDLFDEIMDPELLVRRVNITAAHLERRDAKAMEGFGDYGRRAAKDDGDHRAVYGRKDDDKAAQGEGEQLDMFTDYKARDKEEDAAREADEKELKMQKAMLAIKEKYGKNAILTGTNLEEGATTIERNQQIGGHRS